MLSINNARSFYRTRCRILPQYRDSELDNNTVYYGIFLQPSPTTDPTLYTALLRASPQTAQALLHSSRPDITHVRLTDDARTPLGISIETKSQRAGLISGHAQLAGWVRAHFRQLERVASLAGYEMELPTLPIVFVHGHKWSVDFVERREGATVGGRG